MALKAPNVQNAGIIVNIVGEKGTRRKRCGKKRRIAIRKKTANKRERERIANMSKEEKELTEKVKRTRKNREKKIKKRQKEKLLKKHDKTGPT